ncbi:MAG: calcium/sodium antiporter [Actinomycetota bacterium]
MPGLLVLLVSGHLVVTAASRIGLRFGLTPTVVGLTVVAAGTSAPELAVVFQAIAADDTELAVGSIIGSNIANVLLVLGVVAGLGAITVTSRVVRADIPVMIAASVAFLVLAADGRLGRLDGALLLSGLAVFVGRTLYSGSRARARADQDRDQRQIVVGGGFGSIGRAKKRNDGERTGPLAVLVRSMDRLPVAIAALGVGVAGLALAARLVVTGAEAIAVGLGVPELIVGLTVVAIGTSAPEIVTTVIAAMRGRRDLAVGNAVGSNIFNILLVLGGPTVLTGGISIGDDALRLDLPILVAAAVACLPMVFWDHRLDRWEGLVFVGYYLAYLAFLVLDATGSRIRDPFAVVIIGFVVPLTVLTGVVAVRRHRAVHGNRRYVNPDDLPLQRRQPTVVSQ